MIYLYGAGGHAKVIAEILELNNLAIAGFFDDINPDRKDLKYPVTAYSASHVSENDHLILAIGDNKTRKRLASFLEVAFIKAIHPASIISKSVRIGEGTVVMPGAIINADTVIGKHCIINTSASVDHDCVISDFVHISPHAAICGGVTIGEESHIGTGAIIIPGKKIGSNTVVGAGAVVITDLPDNVVAVGNPAKPIKSRK